MSTSQSLNVTSSDNQTQMVEEVLSPNSSSIPSSSVPVPREEVFAPNTSSIPSPSIPSSPVPSEEVLALNTSSFPSSSIPSPVPSSPVPREEVLAPNTSSFPSLSIPSSSVPMEEVLAPNTSSVPSSSAPCREEVLSPNTSSIPSSFVHREEELSPNTASIPSSSSSEPRVESGERRLRKRTRTGKRVVSFQEPIRRTRRAYKRDMTGDEEYNLVMERAKQIQEQFPPNTASCVKYMRRSHVTLGFWLGLPLGFCKGRLPVNRQRILLVSEDDETAYETNYIADRQGLSGGWKLFCLAHNIVEGDAAVFELLPDVSGEPLKFKVHIVRLKDLAAEVDRAASPSSVAGTSTACNDEEGSRNDVCPPETRSLPVVVYDNSEETNRWSLPFVDYQNFETGLNDSGIRTHLDEGVVQKYYDLCRSQNSFLHHYVATRHSPVTAASAITETVKIADEVRASSTRTPQHKFEEMKKVMIAFEQLGMEVGFLVRRVSELAGFITKATKMAEKLHRLQRKIEGNDLGFATRAAAPW